MMDEKIKQSKEFLDKAIKQYNPDEVFVGFSGGTDSLLCADLTLDYLPDAKIFHANTGIGLTKTREYVRDICEKRGWDLVEIHAKEDCGQDYEQLVMEYGFPGPAMHRKMYQRLKERCTEELHRRYKEKRGNKIMLVTGIRHDESQVRAGYANSIIDKVGGVIWVNAYYWFTQQDKHDYIEANNLWVNPVHNVIGMSGECLCGAYAHKGELDLIRLVEPETADYIENLQERVLERFPWGWEEEPPQWWKELAQGQTMLFGEHEKYQHQFLAKLSDEEREDLLEKSKKWNREIEQIGTESHYNNQPMCVGCGK